jgi:hypothetical protein
MLFSNEILAYSLFVNIAKFKNREKSATASVLEGDGY